MARFKFRLEGVLRHRRYVERRRQRDLALVQAEMIALENQLKTLDRQMKDATGEMRNGHLIGRLDLSYLAAHRRFIAATQQQGSALIEKMGRTQQKVNAARQALTQAMTERKVIEKLREKRQLTWRQEADRKEAAELDEMASQIGFQIHRTNLAENADTD